MCEDRCVGEMISTVGARLSDGVGTVEVVVGVAGGAVGDEVVVDGPVVVVAEGVVVAVTVVLAAVASLVVTGAWGLAAADVVLASSALDTHAVVSSAATTMGTAGDLRWGRPMEWTIGSHRRDRRTRRSSEAGDGSWWVVPSIP